jgi:hypothetical protein
MAPSEGSQQAHDIVVMLLRCCAAGDDPVIQIGIGAIEQRFKPFELRAVEVSEVNLGKSAKDEIALLGSPMPAPVQYPPMSDVRMLLCHRSLLCMSAIDLRKHSTPHLRIHRLDRRHHVLVQIGHDPQRIRLTMRMPDANREHHPAIAVD